MAFWDLANLELERFRPGIMSRAELGVTLFDGITPFYLVPIQNGSWQFTEQK